MNNYALNLHIPKSFRSQPIVEKPVILKDAKEITLAEYSPITTGCITAHRLKDYRHKVYSLMLLPQVSITFDTVLEGLGYFN